MSSPLLVDPSGRPVMSDAARDRAIPATVGTNAPNSVADVQVPFPADWLVSLREISPVTTLHSWLLPYWYRAKERWVLYDAVPREQIDFSKPQAVGLSGSDLKRALEGPPPRELPHSMVTPFVSDAQHEMYRLYGVYARPFWVLEGDRGGHQYAYSPDQKEFLISVGRSEFTPKIGSLPAAPFDGRVIAQLQRLNRLYTLKNSLEQLRASGSSEAAEAQRAVQDAEMRKLSIAMIEQQLGEVVEMAQAMGHRTDTQDCVIDARGQAAQAAEALAAYVETGAFIL